MKRLTILAAAGVLVATPAVGAWAAFASTDDSPSHVRVDDRTTGARHGEPEPGDDHGRHHGHHHRHGADDPAGHVRHSGEAEPGDDHGRHHHGEAEPGDDHGRHHHGEAEPGDDHGRHHAVTTSGRAGTAATTATAAVTTAATTVVRHGGDD